MNKRYKTWWVILATVVSFIWANWLLYALIGLSLIAPSNEGQGFLQLCFGVLGAFAVFIPVIDGKHLKGH